MTTYTLDGPISSIVTAEEYDISSLSGASSGSPTTISPSGAKRTIIMASGSSGAEFFQMSGSFNVGDIVEIYNASNPAFGLTIFDENGNDITSNALVNDNTNDNLRGAVYRKVQTGAGRTWGYPY